MPLLSNAAKAIPPPLKNVLKLALFRPGSHERAVLAGALKGLRFDFDLRADTQKWRGVYEQSLQRWLSEYVEPGSTCLDVGAADGYFSVFMAKLAGPTGAVHAFEPSELCERIPSNVELNKHTHALAPVSVYNQFVVSNTACSDQPSGVSIDEVVTNASLERVDVIKVDADGAEADVLRGACRTLERFHPHLCVEIHSRDLSSAVRQILGRYGYTLRLEDAAPHEYRPIEYNAFLFSEERDGGSAT